LKIRFVAELGLGIWAPIFITGREEKLFHPELSYTAVNFSHLGRKVQNFARGAVDSRQVSKL